MIRRDLLTGHWKPYLERALSLKPCYEGGINGGEVCFLCLLLSVAVSVSVHHHRSLPELSSWIFFFFNFCFSSQLYLKH